MKKIGKNLRNSEDEYNNALKNMKSMGQMDHAFTLCPITSLKDL